jgi:aspartate aminotransferase-like enzyme
MERMRRNIRAFIEEAHARGLDTCLAAETAVVPVLVGRDEDAFELSTLLRQNGVFVPPAVYPAVPKNKARLRFCVISEHKPEQIVKALDTLERVAQEAGVVLPRRRAPQGAAANEGDFAPVGPTAEIFPALQEPLGN